MNSIKTPVKALVDFMHRYFIWMIIASYFVAAVMPGAGLWMRNTEMGSINLLQSSTVVSLPLLMLALLLINAGLGVQLEELNQLIRKPFVLLGGVFGNLATPLIFIIVMSFTMKLWHNPEEVQQILVGLALVAAMPIAGASTAWAQNANGNLAVSLGLVLFTTLLSPLLTPLVFHAVGFVTTGDYSEDLHELASDQVVNFLGTWVIFPSLVGILARLLVGERLITLMKPYLKLINYAVIVLLNYANASLSLPKVISKPDFDYLVIMLIIVFALCIFAFMSGYWLSRIFRVDRNGTVSLMFGLGMNNNGTGLVLASIALSDHPEVMLPIVFYNLIQHLVASSVDFTLIRRQPA